MNKICETLDEVKDIIESFKDTDYILSTNRIKRFMRILTILGSVIVPFILISCIYALIAIPRNGAGFPVFVIAIVIMCVAAGLILIMLRSKRLI
jgi:Mg2+ and Co2+ transporter CorA